MSLFKVKIMKNAGYSSQTLNSYLVKFQESQYNLNAVIKEVRIRKRIEKSKRNQIRIYD